MRLQVNLRGSWRDVLSFSSEHEIAVRNAAESLWRVAEGKVAFRIADENLKAIAHCQAPDCHWVDVINRKED